MHCKEVKNILNDVLFQVESDIQTYVQSPGKDFSRIRKISPSTLMSFLISQGASSSKAECIDFFQLSPDAPSISAINQRRSQLKPEALKQVFRLFTDKIQEISSSFPDSSTSKRKKENVASSSDPVYRFLAADGSTVSFNSCSRFADEDYHVTEGHSADGFYSIHINAMYDLERRIYTDAALQAVHNKNEFLAFCQLVDQDRVPENEKHVYIGDRGYCSYNNMAHVREKEQYFLFRTKDKDRKGLIGNFEFPESEEFDIDINVTLVRKKKKDTVASDGHYLRRIDKEAAFDYIAVDSDKSYDLSFRVVRFQISEDTYECIVTNLPREQFSSGRIKELYNSRWAIESSFRKLKYTIGLTSYHSFKPEYIEQEIWAKMIAYNATETIANHVYLEKADRKYPYMINFTVAAHICRLYLRLHTEIESIDVMALIKRELIAVRDGRKFPRLKTAHFRKPKYMIYRAS